MKILNLKLENFRGIKSLEADFQGKDTDIYGENGSGKTTIANAVSYLFTDAPATGEKDFTPKTEGEHNLNHTATMEVYDSRTGAVHTYQKDFHEVWKKKRGSASPEFSGHEVTYSIDGVPARKKDYDAAMEALCGGDPKRALMLSRVGYFAEEMPWAERRRILFEVCGDVSDEEVMKQPGLAELKDVLRKPGGGNSCYTPEEYILIAKAQRRDLNKKLEGFPARLDELSRTLPEGEAAGEGWLEETDAAIRAMEKEKADMMAAASADTSISAYQAAITGIKSEMEKERAKFLAEVNKQFEAASKRTAALREELYQMGSDLRKLRQDKSEGEGRVARMKQQRAGLLAQFDELKKRRWDPAQETCPTCGQSLPRDAVEELRANFRAGLAKEKARINKEGQAVSTEAIAKAEADVAGISEAIKAMETAVAEQQKKLEASKQETAARPSYESTPKYQENAARLAELEENLRYAREEHMVPDTSELDSKLEALREAKAAHKAAAATRERMAELTGEQKSTAAALDKVDQGIALCESFFREKMRLVSEKVDEHFKSVGFLLFEEQINGGLKEACEPLVPDGKGNMVKYKSANTAAKVNAGLEIIDVLSKHYGVYLPVIVDRAESVTDLRPMPDHQVIRLIVSEKDKELRVEKGA